MSLTGALLILFVLAILGSVSITIAGLILNKVCLKLSWLKLRKITGEVKEKQHQFEIRQSLLSTFVTILIGFGFVLVLSHFKIIDLFVDFEFWKFSLSFILMLILADLHLYTFHRLMHLPWLYKYFHKDHHKSIQLNFLSAYSLDILESAVYSIFIGLFAIFFYTPWFLILIFTIITGLYNFYTHSGYEILPSWLVKSQILNTATFHNIHHRQISYNYGLYFVIWDKLFGSFKSR